MRVIVLGAGRVGSAMAIDLAKDSQFTVSVADKLPETLARLKKKFPLHTIQADLSEGQVIQKIVADSDLVVNAMPGFLGFRTCQSVIEAGKNLVDIAFFPEDPFRLDALAKEQNVTAIVDCGVAPGMSNLLVGHAASRLEEVELVTILVGGLPMVRNLPYEYKAVFSPIDVIEEYTRPSRIVENRQVVIREALSEPELLDFPAIGTLEAFNSDGLRTLAETIPAKNMKEKTLRYPGHIEKMRLLRDTGFFSQEPVEINGIPVRPIELTAKLLFPIWQLQPGEEDFTVMRIVVEGKKGRKKHRYVYDLLDYFDRESQTTSMSRTTGYTATTAVRMLTAGLYNRKGISPPEYIGKDPKCVDFILKGLREKGVIYRETIEEIGPK